MTSRPANTSRLWHVLGAYAPLVRVESTAHPAAWDDSSLVSLSFTRGTTLRGLSSCGGRIVVKGDAPRLTTAHKQGIRATLTPHAIERLSTLGLTVDAGTRHRFTGRVVGQTTIDNGPTPGKYTTTIDVQDWAALLSQLDRSAVITTAAPGLDKVIDSLFARGGIPVFEGTQKWGSEWHHVLIPAGSPPDYVVSTSDALRYLEEAGVLGRTGRSGVITIFAHDHLVDLANDWQTYWPETILRAQVNSPVEWVQPEVITTQLSYSKRTATGTVVTGSVTIGDPGFTARAQHLDLTHLVEQGDLTDSIVAKASELAPDVWHVEKFSLDLLNLIDRAGPTDLAVASQLLNAEHGDIVVLAHDWPVPVVGVYFIRSITETIERDSWRLEVELSPANHVTGRPVPPVHGRTWESAYPAHITWDTPDTATWDTVPLEA